MYCAPCGPDNPSDVGRQVRSESADVVFMCGLFTEGESSLWWRKLALSESPDVLLDNALLTIEGALRTGLFLSPDLSPDLPSERSSREHTEALRGTLLELERQVQACRACQLAAGRQHVVFGQGVTNPTVLVVGEGPGAEEDNQGLPFVGASGKLLDKMLASIGLSRETNCYIANVVKCRPPNNREPTPEERARCLPYLQRQIQLLAPEAILCAGRTAIQALLGTTEGINRLRGKTYDYEGIPVIATYHPSALLRDESLKRPAWEDLKRLRALFQERHPMGSERV